MVVFKEVAFKDFLNWPTLIPNGLCSLQGSSSWSRIDIAHFAAWSCSSSLPCKSCVSLWRCRIRLWMIVVSSRETKNEIQKLRFKSSVELLRSIDCKLMVFFLKISFTSSPTKTKEQVSMFQIAGCLKVKWTKFTGIWSQAKIRKTMLKKWHKDWSFFQI